MKIERSCSGFLFCSGVVRAVAVAFLSLALGGRELFADELMRQVQEELRKRNLYFGDVDGRPSKAINSALRRYQERKGIASSGLPDQETLSSLGLQHGASLPPQGGWPDEPILRSDLARQMSEQDRELLERMQAQEGEPPPIAEPPDKAPTSEELKQEAAAQAAAVAREAEQVIRQYLEAAAGTKVEDELQYYADKVDYFDHGVVDRSFIENDVRRYWKRWPRRKYELLELKSAPSHTGGAEAEVRFRIRFEVSNDRTSVTGRTDNIFRLKRAGDGWQLIFLRERRVRD